MGTVPQPTTGKTLFVLDSTANARFPTRTHDLIVGYDEEIPLVQTYTFTAHKRLEMPFAHAVKFLKIAEFVVSEDAEGKRRYDPTPSGKQAGMPVRDSNQVVANLSELTIDALLIRCNQMTGGETITKRDGKEAMIDFLINASGKVAPRPTAPQGGDDELEDMADDEVRNMLDDEGF